jgi:hypothetical protein
MPPFQYESRILRDDSPVYNANNLLTSRGWWKLARSWRPNNVQESNHAILEIIGKLESLQGSMRVKVVN